MTSRLQKPSPRGSTKTAVPAQSARLTINPLTPDRWPDIEQLFGARGACGGCWCMWWRRPASEFARNKGPGNRRAFKRIVAGGETPGLIAYSAGIPVGWCALAPRDAYPRLERSRVLKPVDDQPVWSVTCLFVARSHRRSGVSVALLQAAIRFARRHRARILEGYPVDPSTTNAPDAFVWTGLASAYLKAGFHEVARRSVTRPIMRIEVGR